MILNNFYNFLNAITNLDLGSVGYFDDSLYTTYSNIKNISNGNLNIQTKYCRSGSDHDKDFMRVFIEYGRTFKFTGLIPSSESGTFTPSDTTINSISGVTNDTFTYTVTPTDTGMIVICTGTFTNTNSSEITINSVGLVKNVPYYPDYNSSLTNNSFIVAKSLLDEPITVPANTSFIITSKFEFLRQ